MVTSVSQVLKQHQKETEAWKQKAVADLSEFTPERIDKTITQAVSKHLPGYKNTFNNALRQAEALEKKRRTDELTDSAMIICIAVVFSSVVLGLVGKMVGWW